MRLILAAVALLSATTAAAAREQIPVATPDGESVSCVPLIQIRETRVRDDRTIDFIMSGRKVYRNTLPSSCPSLGFEQRFSYATSLSQLCSTDIITVLYQAPYLTPGASCGLGQFQPVTLAR
ncbi:MULTISPECIES: hypothetical protein [unclassified Sphingomonas]|uniref:hypothetical protein n=1 Tax=unclassified Sphingomonas TaxID=196159 RepID=UPI0002897824|nr:MULTISPECIES: hypothetical protein [unclassified Sphingomonas]